MNRAFSITKNGEQVNEDAVLVGGNLIAVSDGAGGGGIFADEWAKYLLEHLPESPFKAFQEFDAWVNDISEAFYNDHEEIAKRKGGLFLEKFYDEGSFATLSAIWRVSDKEYIWLTYGDSVAFAYNPESNELEHSFSHLADFNLPPYLIGLINPLVESGFRTGRFVVAPGSYIFVASDALSHYILAMYYAAVGRNDELDAAINAKSRNSSCVKLIRSIASQCFYEDVVLELYRNAPDGAYMEQMFRDLVGKGLIGPDDYSLAFMPDSGDDVLNDDQYLAEHIVCDIPLVDYRPAPKEIDKYAVIKTLDDYNGLKDTLAHYPMLKLYRAHGDYSWSLIPSLMRSPIGSCEREKQNYHRLKSFLESQGYGRFKLPSFNEELFFLGTGRHLGLKSRLLDWTSGFDVAVDAFLLDEKEQYLAGAMWIMFVPNGVIQREGSPFSISDGDIHVYQEGYYSPDGSETMDFPEGILRRFRQHGFFTVTSEDLTEKPLDAIVSQNGICFMKIKVEPELKALLIAERSKKVYRVEQETIVTPNECYMPQVSKEVSQEVDRMNKYIEGRPL